jgi:hemerythrin superfamily protein
VDAIIFLEKQHDLIEETFATALRSSGQERRAAFEKGADILLAHMTVEEEIFFPAVRSDKTETKMLENLEEHLSLKRLVVDMLSLDPDDKVFEAKLRVVSEQSDHHHDEEEKDLFPVVKKQIAEERRIELGRAMVSREATLLAAGSPRNLAVGNTDAAPRLSSPSSP